MKTIMSTQDEIDENIDRQISEGLKDPANRVVSGFNSKTEKW